MNGLTTGLLQLRNVIVHRTLEKRIIITMDLLTTHAFAFIMIRGINTPTVGNVQALGANGKAAFSPKAHG